MPIEPATFHHVPEVGQYVHVRGGAYVVQDVATTPPYAEREAVKAAFQADPTRTPVRILLATDAAGEGLDLQNHCRYLIHYEIPWNPNRLE